MRVASLQSGVIRQTGRNRSFLSKSVISFKRKEWVALGFGLLIAAMALVALGRAYAAAFFMVWLIAISLFYSVQSPESTLCVFAFAQPFESIFFLYGVGRFNTLSYLAMALLVLWYFRHPRFRRALEGYEWLFSALLLWCVLTPFWATSPMASIESLVTLIGGFATFLVYCRGLVNLLSIRRVLWFYVIGAL